MSISFALLLSIEAEAVLITALTLTMTLFLPFHLLGRVIKIHGTLSLHV